MYSKHMYCHKIDAICCIPQNANKSPSSISGIITQAYLWGRRTCTFESRESRTTLSYGGLCTTREGVGTRPPYSWAASTSHSRLLCLRSALACLTESPPWMTSPSRTVRCPWQWRSALRTHISTACTPRHVWSTCSCATLWMTAGMDLMRRDVVSVSFGHECSAQIDHVKRSSTELLFIRFAYFCICEKSIS